MGKELKTPNSFLHPLAGGGVIKACGVGESAVGFQGILEYVVIQK